MAYCTLQQVRSQLETGQTADNAFLASKLTEASQLIDDITGLWFDERYLTLGFSGEVGITTPTLGLEEWPLISVDSLLNGDGSTVSPSNYSLLPVGRYPKEGIRLAAGNYWLAPNQNTATCPGWSPLLDHGYAEDAIQVAGRWGWHRRYASAWKNTGLTVSGAHSSSVAVLTMNAQALTAFDVGSVLKIVIASGAIEYLYVNGPVANSTATNNVSSFTTAAPTVDRAFNGSTALAFVGGETIYVWQPEPVIAGATAELVAAAYKSRDNATGQAMNAGGFGSMTITDIPQKVLDKLRWPYVSWRRGMPVGMK